MDLQEFWAAMQYTMQHVGDETELPTIIEMVDEWRGNGKYFAAGWTLSHAKRAAWGRPQQMQELTQEAIAAFQKSFENSKPESLESLAALFLWSQELSQLRLYFDIDISRDSVLEELAQYQLIYHGNTEHKQHFLVTGIKLRFNFNDGLFVPIFPEYEVE